VPYFHMHDQLESEGFAGLQDDHFME
jgi:hypothetical protein